MPKKACPTGYVRNPDTGRCRKDCPRSPNTGRCLKNAVVKRKSSKRKSPKRKSSKRKSPKKFVPTKIKVKNMNGTFTYDFVTKSATDTYGDIKDELLPLLQAGYTRLNITHNLFRINQLILYNDDGVRFDDNDAPISKKIVQLNVHVDTEIEPEWTIDEQSIIDRIRRRRLTRDITIFSHNAPGEIAAFVYALQNIDKSTIERLIIHNTNMVPAIMEPIRQLKSLQEIFIFGRGQLAVTGLSIESLEVLLRENRTIKRLSFSYNYYNADEITELLNMIGRNDTLLYFYMDNNNYHLNDLANLLRVNTSLDTVSIHDCMQVDGDLSNLVDVLLHYKHAGLDLKNNRMSSYDRNEKKFFKSLRRQGCEISDSAAGIDLECYKSE